MTGAPATDPRPESASSGASGDPVSRLTVGRRVVVRHRLDGEARATDVLGTLVSRDDESLVVDSRQGPVTVRRDAVVAAKEVPPPPTRPGPPHERVSADDLELLMAEGWPAVERAGLGSWLLRSAPGYTGRANSALPVGDPTLPLDRALDYVEKWYTDRGQRPLVQVHGSPRFRVDDHPVGSALLRRGWTPGGGRSEWMRVLVMTAPAAAVPPLTQSSVPVVADARLSPEWLLAYGEQRTVVPGVTESVLAGSDGVLFLSVRDEPTGRVVAVARMAIHPGWAGLFAVWVHPAHRRRGLATTMTSAAAMLARQNAMPSMYLQVSDDNPEAVRLYEGLGFGVHHEYTYLAAPAD